MGLNLARAPILFFVEGSIFNKAELLNLFKELKKSYFFICSHLKQHNLVDNSLLAFIDMIAKKDFFELFIREKMNPILLDGWKSVLG